MKYSTQLKRRTLELVLTEGQFNMQEIHGVGPDSQHLYSPQLGHACCIAANILLAYSELDEAGRKQLAYGEHTGNTAHRAREIWGKAFGGHASKRLDFYGRNAESVVPRDAAGVIDLRSVTPEQAAAHLLGQPLGTEPSTENLRTIEKVRDRLQKKDPNAPTQDY